MSLSFYIPTLIFVALSVVCCSERVPPKSEELVSPPGNPSPVRLIYYTGGGYFSHFNQIEISGRILKYADNKGMKKEPRNLEWQAEISAEDATKLADTFAKSNFSSIRNQEVSSGEYDAILRKISADFDNGEKHEIIFGSNYSLKKEDEDVFEKLASEILFLAEKYAPPDKKPR